MSLETLDFYFPFLVFAYGAMMTMTFQLGLDRLAGHRIPDMLLERFRTHRLMGYICFFVGGLWSLQHLLN
jgi:hypothetical protein